MEKLQTKIIIYLSKSQEFVYTYSQDIHIFVTFFLFPLLNFINIYYFVMFYYYASGYLKHHLSVYLLLLSFIQFSAFITNRIINLLRFFFCGCPFVWDCVGNMLIGFEFVVEQNNGQPEIHSFAFDCVSGELVRCGRNTANSMIYIALAAVFQPKWAK